MFLYQKNLLWLLRYCIPTHIPPSPLILLYFLYQIVCICHWFSSQIKLERNIHFLLFTSISWVKRIVPGLWKIFNIFQNLNSFFFFFFTTKCSINKIELSSPYFKEHLKIRMTEFGGLLACKYMKCVIESQDREQGHTNYTLGH